MKYASVMNNPARAGQRASVTYSLTDPFSMYAIHTRGDAVEWFVVHDSAVDEL